MLISDEIFLQSNDTMHAATLPKLDLSTVEEKLSQINTFKNTARRFAIFNEHYLYVKSRSLTQEKEYVLDLFWMDPQRKRRLQVPWRWLESFALFAFIDVLCYTLAFVWPVLPGDPLWHACAGIILTMLALLCLSAAVYFTHYFHIYLSRFGGVELVSLLPNTPNRNRYEAFCNALQSRASETGVSDPSHALARALQMHRQLKELGIITETQYATAKQHILSGHN